MRRQQVPILRRGHSHCLKCRTPAGKQKWESFPTEEEAQERRQEILEQIKDESYAEPKTFTFEDFATEWLEQRLSIRGSTASAYASIIRRHLIPYFGKMKLSAIRPNVVQRFVIDLSLQQVSSKTVHNAITLLGGMLASPKGLSAARRGLIRYDPTLGIELPRVDPREIFLLTVEQAWRLINAAAECGRESHGLVYLAANTGLRRVEILAVSFCDVDWERQELRVSRALNKYRAHDSSHRWMWKLGPTKTSKSRRRIGLSEEVMKVLASLRQTAANPDGLIFSKPDGQPIDPDYLDALFEKVRAKVKMPDVRFHDLRHFFASMLIAQG